MSKQEVIRARPADTSPEVWAMHLRRLAAMSPAQRLAIADQLSIDCCSLSARARAEER